MKRNYDLLFQTQSSGPEATPGEQFGLLVELGGEMIG
jgi:hypothetical protein